MWLKRPEAPKRAMKQASGLSAVPSALAAAHAADRDGRQWRAGRVDEQGDRSSLDRNGSFEEIDGV